MKCAMLVVSEVQTSDLRIRADRHALGLDADRDLAGRHALVDIDDGHHRVVLVGDVEQLAGGIERELLGIRAGGQFAGVL